MNLLIYSSVHVFIYSSIHIFIYINLSLPADTGDIEVGVSLTIDPSVYDSCGRFLETVSANSRIRFPCESAKGRYVFVNSLYQITLTEVEVYVHREYHVMAALVQRLDEDNRYFLCN